MSKTYDVPATTMHRVEQSIKRSRFITSVARVSDVEAARTFITAVRDEFPDATHNCWAFNAGPPGDTAHIGMSDDGEPHNSAGKPMLQTLLHSGVGEIAAVVTRYFGGVKLGVGGLVRAYSGSVAQALEELPREERITPKRLSVTMAYSFVDQYKHLMNSYRITLLDEQYTDKVRYILELPEDEAPSLILDIENLTNGSARVETD